jgi:hypothetical protein
VRELRPDESANRAGTYDGYLHPRSSSPAKASG